MLLGVIYSPYGSTNCIRFKGYDLSPEGTPESDVLLFFEHVSNPSMGFETQRELVAKPPFPSRLCSIFCQKFRGARSS
jgi:hypothetical protein